MQHPVRVDAGPARIPLCAITSAKRREVERLGVTGDQSDHVTGFNCRCTPETPHARRITRTTPAGTWR
jgi:hypothetical protein